MGHKNHEPEIPKVPDWRIYQVQDVPELMNLQKALASHGLKDPWARNEVWKFTEGSYKHKRFQNLSKLLFSGFKYGLAAAIITSIVEAVIMRGNGHGEHDNNH